MFGNFSSTVSFFTTLGTSLPCLCSLKCNYLEIETYFSKQYMIGYLFFLKAMDFFFF